MIKPNKLYLKANYVDTVCFENKITVYVHWTIDLSKIPQVHHLTNFLSEVMKEKDWNDIHPTIDYENGNGDYNVLSFITYAFAKVKEGEKYDKELGYQIAINKAERSAIKAYKKLMKKIVDKMHDYWLDNLYMMEIKARYVNDDLLEKFNSKLRKVQPINK